MIDPMIWQDEEFGALSSNAKLLFIGLFSNADDEGRIRANKAYLKSTIFMYDSLTPDQIENARNEVVNNMDTVQLYVVGGKEYIQLRNWNEYQKQHKDRIQESTLPACNDGVSVTIKDESDDVSDNVGQVSDNVGVSKDKLSQDRLDEVSSDKDNSGASLPENTYLPGDYKKMLQDTRPKAAGPLAAGLQERYGFTPQTSLKPGGITTEHQAKGFEYAEKLGIKLRDGSRDDTGRWLRIFKDAAGGKKISSIDKAYSYCKDMPDWDFMDDVGKLNMFFKIYASS